MGFEAARKPGSAVIPACLLAGSAGIRACLLRLAICFCAPEMGGRNGPTRGDSCDDLAPSDRLLRLGRRVSPVTVTLTCSLRPAISAVIMNLPGTPETK